MFKVEYRKGDWQKYKGRGDITKVVIHRDVDEIEHSAFRECKNLTELDWGATLLTFPSPPLPPLTLSLNTLIYSFKTLQTSSTPHRAYIYFLNKKKLSVFL
ncbi:hypothetical protein TrLO_g5552 [Triparma laevis f. longispina]|uniref:Uncharacterized protein n=1 Tax=Triparma laevis f. longispina TaxID=1714387 RepID=A0A9W7F542_9STRA|nr:hypothetical protein TrLO_g5552 [Triparma laevis f. longispina]